MSACSATSWGACWRDEEGEEVFEAIEAIRQASVAYHREGTPERAAKLDELLRALSLPDALRFAHSFVCFSQLINIAEDQGARRRLRAGEGAERSLTGAIERLAEEGVDAAAMRAPARSCAGHAGDHRPSQRGAAQERHRPRQPHRRDLRRLRPRQARRRAVRSRTTSPGRS